MSPSDTNRRIALIAGILFFGFGLLLMVLGIQAEGYIDIQSELVSGKIKTGSAGLFVAFLSFLIIIFSIIRPKSNIAYEKKSDNRSALSSRGIGLIAIALICALLALIILISVFAEVPEGFGGGLFIAGFGLGYILFTAIIATLLLQAEDQM